MSGSKKPHSIRKRPLAALLAERGIFNTEDEARRWVMGGKVLANGQRIDKPGMLLPGDAVLDVQDHPPYASRGGHKPASPLGTFAVAPHPQPPPNNRPSSDPFSHTLPP